MKAYVHTKTCTQMFTVFLFITAKTGNNPAVVQPTVKKTKTKTKTTVHPCHGILLSNKKQWTTDTHNSLGESPRELSWVKKANSIKLHCIWFHIYKIPLKWQNYKNGKQMMEQ